MTQAVQLRKGTTSEHASFTGLQAEATVDTTKKTIVIHDGSTAGGVPLSREDLSNSNPTNLSAINGADTASGDLFVVYDVSASAFKKITRAELNNAIEQDALASVAITGGTINNTAIGGTTAAAGSFTTLTTSSTVTLNGGTANGVLYLNGSKVATSGSALTFDGTNLINLGGVVRALAAATQDALQLQGRTGGTSSYITTLTPGTLTASNTLTLPVGTTTLAGLGTTQTFSAAQTFSSTVTMSGTTTNIALGTSQTSGTWTAGGAAQTGTITLDQSTKAHTLNIGTGATENATTKTINIGTAGVSGSTTNLTYGSGVTGSTTTHIWNSGGSEQMRLTSTGLGIGTTSPTANLTVAGGTHLRGYTAPNTSFASLVLGITGGEAYIQPYTTGIAQIPMNLEGSTVKINTGGSTRATFDSSGNLGLGVTPSAWRSTTKAFQGAAGAIYDFSTTGKGITQNAYLKEAPDAWTYVNNGTAAQLDIGSGQFAFYTAPSGTAGNAISFTQAMLLNASGGLQTLNTIGVGNATPSASGAGITFPATQSASSDANTLDDYEEGSFTPGITFGGGSTGMTFSVQAGQYTKVGRIVYIRANFRFSSKGTSTGSAKLTGLPYTSLVMAGGFSGQGLLISGQNGFSSVTSTIGIQVDEISTEATFTQGFGSLSTLTDANFAGDSSQYFSITGWYTTNT